MTDQIQNRSINRLTATSSTGRTERNNRRNAATALRAHGSHEHNRIDRISEPTEALFLDLHLRDQVAQVIWPPDPKTGHKRIKYTPRDKAGNNVKDPWTNEDKETYLEKYEVYLKDENDAPFLWGVAHIHFDSMEATVPSLRGQHFKLPGQEAWGNHNEQGEWVVRNRIHDPATLPLLRKLAMQQGA